MVDGMYNSRSVWVELNGVGLSMGVRLCRDPSM